VIYPSRDQNDIRVSVGFGTEGISMQRGDVAAQKALVASKCEALGGDMPRIIEALKDTPQFYYNELAQIRAPHWSKGRVVLAGDAAHCASPFSGQGTSLALVGAFVLARELERHPDQLQEALAAYETRMRPFVLMNQNMVDLTRQGPISDEIMTRSKNGIDLRDLLAEVA
jgi:2-polyprenyl-6-methoxyphenol hydroxylase-like FAD-dependent oxidoreductase